MTGRPTKAPRRSIRFRMWGVAVAGFVRDLNRSRMRNKRSLTVVCGDEDGQLENRWCEGKERPSSSGFGSSAPAPGVCPPAYTRLLSPSITDDGLQVSGDIAYMRLTLTCDGSSTNARFIESLDSSCKQSVDLVRESRRHASDDEDEDEDALFAELEAELENADSAALRDRGIKGMQAQLRQFSSSRSLNRSTDQPRLLCRLEKVQTMEQSGYGRYTELTDEKEVIRTSA